MTRIKGTPLKSLAAFIQSRFPGRYEEWLQTLPEETRILYAEGALSGSWYPFDSAWVVPNAKMAELFFAADPHGCWERGRHNADVGLRGIYKVFVRIGSPSFLVNRAARLFETLWDGVRTETEQAGPSRVLLRVLGVPEMDVYTEHGVAGFIERALEISGCKGVEVSITRSRAEGAAASEFEARWS